MSLLAAVSSTIDDIRRDEPDADAPAFESRDTFDGDRAIIAREQMARKIAREFRHSRKYPIEASELESEAILQLTQAARDFPRDATHLPFGAYAAQRIVWRLEDFIQAWYRLARRDHVSGREEVRRIVPIGPCAEFARTPAGRRHADNDPNRGLYIEDCRRLVSKVLTPRQRELLSLRYEEHKNLKQVAAIMGMTHVRARQVHLEAVTALRKAMDGVRPCKRVA